MKNKNPANLSAESLVEMAKESHEKVMKEASKKEQEHKKRVAALTEKERELTAKIKAGKEQYEKMKDDFEVLEREQREANLAEIRENEFTANDVKSGKITINQFHAAGKQNDELQKMGMVKTIEDLEKSSDLIREKGTEIVRLELALYETQSSIHSLLTHPVKLLRLSYRELGNMLDYQLEGLTKDGCSAQNLKVEKENQILLIENGVGMSGGQVWGNISLKQAYRVRLDPILPKELIVDLLSKLDEIEGTETTRVTVNYHQPGSFWPGDPIEVRIEEE